MINNPWPKSNPQATGEHHVWYQEYILRKKQIAGGPFLPAKRRLKLQLVMYNYFKKCCQCKEEQ